MKVPVLRSNEIRSNAESFTLKYNPKYDCPVLIENIANTSLDLSIFPVKDFHKITGYDGTISQDFKSILVDQDIYMKVYKRARFTIAHEIGHLVLHSNLFDAGKTKPPMQNFIDYQNSVSVTDWSNLEKQAFLFAQEVLMPHDIYMEAAELEISKLGGIGQVVVTDLESILSKLSCIFDVSTGAVWHKLKYEYPSLNNL